MESISNSLSLLAENNIQLIWQTGKLYIDSANTSLKNFQAKGLIAFGFIKEWIFAYAAADVVVSRAGAITISELCAVKKPVILIPFPKCRRRPSN